MSPGASDGAGGGVLAGTVVVATARLALVALAPAALAAVRSGVRAVLPDVRAWAPDYPTDGDVLLAGLALGPGPLATTDAPWGLLQVRVLAPDGPGVAVGGIGFKTPPVDGEAEVGYGLAASARGQGLMTEAVGGMLAVARRHGLVAVTAHTDPSNGPSIRLLERNGFTPSGRGPAGGPDAGLLRWRREV